MAKINSNIGPFVFLKIRDHHYMLYIAQFTQTEFCDLNFV